MAFPKPVGCLPEVGNLTPQIWPGPKFSWGHSRLMELGTAAFRVKSAVCWTDGIFYHFNCLWGTNGQWFREIIFGTGAEKTLKFLNNLGEYKAIIVFYTQVQLKNIKSGEQTEMTLMIGHHWICKSLRRGIGTMGMVINESYISLGSWLFFWVFLAVTLNVTIKCQDNSMGEMDSLFNKWYWDNWISHMTEWSWTLPHTIYKN